MCGKLAKGVALRVELGLTLKDAQGIAIGAQSLAYQQGGQNGRKCKHPKTHAQRLAHVLDHEGDEVVLRYHHQYRPVAVQQVVERRNRADIAPTRQLEIASTMPLDAVTIERAADHRVTQVCHAGELDLAIRILFRQLRLRVRDHPAVVVDDECDAGLADDQIPQEVAHAFEFYVGAEYGDQRTICVPVGL